MNKFVLLTLIVLGMAATAGAQQQPCLDRTIPVGVISVNLLLIPNLAPQNFHGRLRGKDVAITSVSPDSGPHRVVIVLDASGSMYSAWNFALRVVKRFLDADQESPVALIVFSDRVNVKVDFAQGRANVAAELDSLEVNQKRAAQGRTALRDAIIAAIDLLGPPQFGDAIYLVSDGGENSSNTDNSQFRARLLASGVRLFALVTSDEKPSRSRTPEEGGPSWLHGFVNATGGDSAIFQRALDAGPGFSVQFPTALTESGEQILSFATIGFANEITAAYRLNVKLPEELSKPHGWDLTVIDSTGNPNQRWRVLYPHQFGACP